MNRIYICCFALFLSFFAFYCHAVDVKGLYQVKMAVPDQTQKARIKAYKQALETVFVRVSGDQFVVNNAGIKRALRNPTKYLVKYQYERVLDDIYLIANFNNVGINNLLKQNEFSIWGSHRPLVLIWSVAELNFDRALIGDDSALYTDNMINTAKKRGLPIMAPLLDMDDAMSVEVSDVWGRFEKPILNASARYQPDLVAAIKMQEQSDIDKASQLSANWVGQVTLFNLDKPYRVELTAASQQLLAQEAVNWIADTLGALYAIEVQAYQSDSEHLVLTFKNIQSISGAIKIERFLNQLSSVNRARVLEVNDFGLQVQLELLGEAIDVFNALELDNQIQQVKPEFGQILPVDNYYNWVGK